MAAPDEAASVKIVGSYAECVVKMKEYADKYNVHYSADFPRTPHNPGTNSHALPAGWMTAGTKAFRVVRLKFVWSEGDGKYSYSP